MVSFIIKGNPKYVSKEELRCILQAQATVMEFHKLIPKCDVKNNAILVKIGDEKRLGTTKMGNQATGKAYSWGIMLGDWLKFKSMFTVGCHEVIHEYTDFEPGTEEKLTSTLNAKLNPSVAEIYNSLIGGVYQRAAFIAHTKISYKPQGKDFYDDSEWDIVEVNEAGKKYRKIKYG